ncbi:Lrp/AsnC family transcriptional regulator [Modestobacter sp. VKM Ac-2985]|uniref:Lrp/AsnC family transcriptional regulator n=1 Tax=Modestobacter sp. VKM Ac-2985 TaxID=3004139 RepID=UPI0022ABB586|nr:AsnC family transcriptional regulator [Modestobacter sp. VKM Ac-2985]MCZ2837212.1 AsnC family transcriptional regulator [Modestobacter sp. VKM Ac-2985]
MATVLDALDRQIVHAMQVDGRAPFSRISAALGVSEQTVARRWRRLRADGVVRVLGLTTPEATEPSWHIRMRVQPAAAGAVAEALARRPDVSWVSLTAGGAEITCSTRPRTARQRDALLLDRLPRTVQVIDLAAFSVLHSYVGGAYEWTDFDDPLSAEQIAALGPDSARADPTPVVLDPEDELLLAALATDGRLSWAELAGVTGWSESRVARRVEALRSAGALYFDLEIATELLGHPVSALLWLGVAPKDIAHVGESLARAPETGFTAVVTGPANLMVAVTCRDTAHLYRFLTDRVGALPVRTLETSTVLRRVKQAGSLMDGPRLTDPEPPPVRGR